MRKLILCTLVIIITFITVVVMATFKTDPASETSNISLDTVQQDGKPDGTGYIFDDFNKGINIPVDECNKESMENNPKEIDNNFNASYRSYKTMKQELKEAFAPVSPGNVSSAAASNKKYNEENQKIAQKTQTSMSADDKLYFASMAKKIDLQDILTVKEAVDKGATFEEINRTWDKFKNKLPREEYDKLVEILQKYEGQ